MSYLRPTDLVTFRPLRRVLIPDAEPRHAPFRADWTDTMSLLARELLMLDAKRGILEVDLHESDLRLDGLPRVGARIATPGIALSFHSELAGGDLRFTVTTFDHWTANIRAVAHGLKALRAVGGAGITSAAEQYAGWVGLPAGPSEKDLERGQPLAGRRP